MRLISPLLQVSKMKEENKDLPTQRQRLRDMQQEMIGLEHSVLTEETRCVSVSYLRGQLN